MEVLTVYGDPTVLLAGYDDPAILDLVAHFLGIATHNNDNAAPKANAVFGVISGKGISKTVLCDMKRGRNFAGGQIRLTSIHQHGFVAQIGPRLVYPLPRTDLA